MTVQPTSFVLYVRVSTSKQGRSGLGLEAQRDRAERFAREHDIPIIGEEIEVETGKGSDALDRRPKLKAAMGMAKKSKSAILVAKLDRLSRDVHFISGLMSRGVPFVAADLGIDVDPFMLHIYAALAEKERAMISLRTREALAVVKSRGVMLGNTTNLPHAREKARLALSAACDVRASNVLPIINQIQATGASSYAKIADALNARGIASARGGQWHSTSVRNVMRRA